MLAKCVSKSQLEMMTSQLENFASTLFQVIRKSTPGNMCIAPFSVAAVLAMVHAEATGDTARQIKETLGLSSFSDQEMNDNIENLIKSTMWDHKIQLLAPNLCFVVVEDYFGDPRNPKKKNSSVEKFKTIVLPKAGSIGQKMHLSNNVRFKGDWITKFEAKDTQMKPFFLGFENSKVDVKMMRYTGTNSFHTGNLDSLDARFLILPLKGKIKQSFVVILPNTIDGLSKVEEHFCGKVLDEIETNASEKKLYIELPKMKIETGGEFVNALSGIGIKDLFKSGVVHLSGTSSPSGLFVSSFIQKGFVMINETGTDPVTSTSETISAQNDDPPGPFFKVNRPSMFLVKDDATNLILFIGRLADPKSRSQLHRKYDDEK